MTLSTRQLFLCTPVLLTMALLLSPAATLAGDNRAADSVVHHFQIGYERGISLRYFPVRAWGIGLVASSSTLYQNDFDETEYFGSSDSSRRTYRDNEKNITLAVEGLRRIVAFPIYHKPSQSYPAATSHHFSRLGDRFRNSCACACQCLFSWYIGSLFQRTSGWLDRPYQSLIYNTILTSQNQPFP